MCVRVVQCIGHFGGDLHRVLDTELRFAIQFVAQRFAVDERHHVVQESVGCAGVKQREDVRMLQRGGGLDFHHEPFGAKHRSEFGFQHLERNLSIVLEIGGQKHVGHATLPQFALNAVTVGQGGGEAFAEHGHV